MSRVLLIKVIDDVIAQHAMFGAEAIDGQLTLDVSREKLARSIASAVVGYFKQEFWTTVKSFFVSEILE